MKLGAVGGGEAWLNSAAAVQSYLKPDVRRKGVYSKCQLNLKRGEKNFWELLSMEGFGPPSFL